MKNIKINKSKIITIAVTLAVGLGLGWILFGGSSGSEMSHQGHSHEAESGQETIWTCAMHPQIRQNKPGQCPICGMDLTPLNESGSEVDNNYTYQMTESAMALANVQTTTVVKANEAVKEIILTGKIEADERRIYEIPAHFHGRLEKLYVNFTGEYVSKGEILASVYSPDLVTAQQELLEALPYKETNPALFRAARSKLKNWKIADTEIDNIEQSGVVKTELPIRAHHAGVVRKRNVAVGDHVSMGDILFEVVDLSHLWVMLDAYEQHLQWINLGDKVTFTVASIPGETFEAKVTFIDPFINPHTRVAKVRAEVGNRNRKLKPEMFVKGIIKARPSSDKSDALLIPQSAILWTGARSLVYVKKTEYEKPTFEYRQVKLGALSGDYFVVKEGLFEGEEVVTNGTFSIDAAAQLSGKASMMNPEGGSSGGTMPGMPGMKMGEGAKTKNKQVSTQKMVEGQAYSFRDQAPAAFRGQLDDVIDAYLSLKNGLIEGDENTTAKYSTALYNALQKVNGGLLQGDAAAFWEEKKSFLMQHAKLCKEAPAIAGKRENFIYLSQPLIKLVEAFGPRDEKLYVDYCPMANDNKGAFWLSETKEIRNPFMSEAMRSCGEVKQEILSN
ncbi:efflux RND transporter periplasmic adaptor subunit [Marinoscillum luteum]|uniref:Efflux RND transporter periplasmic adaptor subunit n=1 Tax=Marinoscillum luteum TaxID=861051 RepID=A0ABW7N780_9BACT